MNDRAREAESPAQDAERYSYLRGALASLEPARKQPFLDALHLAAHAVTAVVCGAEYGPLRLGRDSDARCAFAPPSSAGRGPARNATEAAIISALAGNEAEALAGGEPRGTCIDVTRWLTDGDPAEAQPYIEWLRLKAARTVEHALRQRLILLLAQALLERGALSGVDAAVLDQSEVSRYMRGR